MEQPMHDRTLSAVEKMLTALASPSYVIGILSTQAMLRSKPMSRDDVLSRLAQLKGYNSRGRNIYICPAGAIRYTLLDDLTCLAVKELYSSGFAPCAVVETSPNNFQAWLQHSVDLTQELASQASKLLAHRFHGDPSATGWQRFGRLAGFTNRKPSHQQPNGLYPFVLLRSASGREFPRSSDFLRELSEMSVQPRTETQPQGIAVPDTLSPQRGRRFSHLSLLRFRALTKYTGQAACADMAFCIAALANAMPEQMIADCLREHYLSSDPSESKREVYVGRTLRKAIGYVGRQHEVS
jgi:hypothetical protein